MERRNSLLSQQIEQLKNFMLSKGYSSRALKYYTPSWNQLLEYANSHTIEYYTTELGQKFLCEACGINLSSCLSTTEKKILRGVRLVETFLQDGAIPNVCRKKPPIPLQFILLRNEYADHLRCLGQKKKPKVKTVTNKTIFGFFRYGGHPRNAAHYAREYFALPRFFEA